MRRNEQDYQKRVCMYIYIYIYIYMYVACKVQSVILVTVQWNMNFLSRF